MPDSRKAIREVPTSDIRHLTSDIRHPSSAQHAAFWAILIAAVLVGIEFGCFGLTRLRPDLFDNREAVLAVLAALQPADFNRVEATTASDLLGWDNPASMTAQMRNCTGQEITYTYGRERTRLHGRAMPADATVLVAGDSYTHGNEVADEDTYPAELERILGVPTANLGVSGYGPDQAVLKLESQIDSFPLARLVVLSILYDDTSRMLNSFRPLLQRPTGRNFGLKPFVEGDAFREIVGGNPFRDFAAFKAAASSAFDADYWRRARPGFPYSASVAHMMVLTSFWVPTLTDVTAWFGRPHYDFFHRIPFVRQSLRTLYGRFMEWTSKRRLRGIVVFIPVDPHDQTSGLTSIAAATDAQRRALTFHNVTVGDGRAYGHREGCHPSATGYRTIAANVATVVRRSDDR